MKLLTIACLFFLDCLYSSDNSYLESHFRKGLPTSINYQGTDEDRQRLLSASNLNQHPGNLSDEKACEIQRLRKWYVKVAAVCVCAVSISCIIAGVCSLYRSWRSTA